MAHRHYETFNKTLSRRFADFLRENHIDFDYYKHHTLDLYCYDIELNHSDEMSVRSFLKNNHSTTELR